MRHFAGRLRCLRPYALLAALCLLLYLPGIAAIPPLDRDEARFAQATRQMLETGDFLRIRFQDEARNKKPAGIYWLQAVAGSALSTPAASAVVPAASLSIADRETRWLRRLHPAVGSLAMVVAVAPWLIAIEHATEGRFLADALGGDLLTKLVGARELHGAPPFSYLLLSVASFWPGSLILVPAMVHAWRRHELPVERFLLAWLVPSWVFLELVPTKLPHYVLPLFPALALLAAAALADGIRLEAGTWARRLRLLVSGAWVVASLGLAMLLIGLPLRFGDHLAIAGVLGAVLLLAVTAALVDSRAGPGRTT